MPPKVIESHNNENHIISKTSATNSKLIQNEKLSVELILKDDDQIWRDITHHEKEEDWKKLAAGKVEKYLK